MVVKRILRRMRRALHPRRAAPGSTSAERRPLVSIVVPGFNVAEYLQPCLESILTQDYRNLEVIVIDDGSHDGTYALARKVAKRDSRVRVFRQPNKGLSATRNRGVGLARGEYLWFVDSDDSITPGSVGTFVAALEKSGSDFAVASYRRFDSERLGKAPAWSREAHAEDRWGIALADWPEATVNALACSKMFRLSFWREIGLSFPVGVTYEDQQVTAEAYARATSFDYLSFVAYNWRLRDDGTSITQQVHTVGDVRDRMVAARTTLEVLTRYSGSFAVDARRRQLLANDVPRSAAHLGESGEEFWDELVAGVRALIPGDVETTLAEVTPNSAVLLWAIYNNFRTSAQEFVASGGREIKAWPTITRESGTYIDYPSAWFPQPVPTGVTRFPDALLRPNVRALRLQWIDVDTLEVSGWAFVNHVDPGVNPPLAAVTLVETTSGRRVALSMARYSEPLVDRYVRQGAISRQEAGFRATLNVNSVEEGLPSGEYAFHVDVTSGGVSRSAIAEPVRNAGAFAFPSTRRVGQAYVQTVVDRASGLRLRVRAVAPLTARLVGNNGRVDVVVEGGEPGGDKQWSELELLDSRSGQVITTPFTPDGDQGQKVAALPPAMPGPEGESKNVFWRVRLVGGQRGTTRAAIKCQVDVVGAPFGPDLGECSIKETAAGNLGVLSYVSLMIVDHVRLEGADLVIAGSNRGAHTPTQVWFDAKGRRLPGDLTINQGRWIVRLDLATLGAPDLECFSTSAGYRLVWDVEGTATELTNALGQATPMILEAEDSAVLIKSTADRNLELLLSCAGRGHTCGLARE